ncbi:MAG: hypothetical protein EKK35_02290 [Bradyrhizobiaceae bacterium]|uniref:Uncharacterized protein n=2 Tax=Nitrobacteraceae TaxID=41294 RepID=K8P327_9BRAD|nr:hypothetical protein HMPREF9695_04010 [Afipia broomeae ATCC 49717]MAH69554.1 hypothetical protein [Afipia sp.]OUX61539.1 MAG: hypothetical protein CBB64_09955 [Afipia sp. TMED4]RTL83903.1 MAG: hypothetical protein EKK35_02290 [Bradyrhizobiaceae bacterium]HAO44198.1 hypothetical protein [Afipia sp.]
MSNMASGTLGVVAAVLALGAVHLEVSAGNDLLGPVQRGEAAATMPAGESMAVNVDRSAKGDRDPVAAVPGGVTISFKVPGMTDSSVMVRMPSGDAAEAVRKAPSTVGTGRGSSAGTRPVACEPVVSVLTAVAKQLAPGRCIT